MQNAKQMNVNMKLIFYGENVLWVFFFKSSSQNEELLNFQRGSTYTEL